MLLRTKLMQFFASDIGIGRKFYFDPMLMQQILGI